MRVFQDSYHMQLSNYETGSRPVSNHHLAYEYDRADKTSSNDSDREETVEEARMKERGE